MDFIKNHFLKIYITVYAILIVVWWITAFSLVIKVSTLIQEKGLKSAVEQVWNGNN